MIRNSKALSAVVSEGRTIVRLSEFDGARAFRWVLSDTNEPVHGTAVKTLIKREALRTLASDLCGDPMQYGAV